MRLDHRPSPASPPTPATRAATTMPVRRAGSALGSSRVAGTSFFPPETQYVVQVFHSHGRLTESNQAAGAASLLTTRHLQLVKQRSMVLDVFGLKGDRMRLLAAPTSRSNSRVVLVGASLDTINRLVARVRRDDDCADRSKNCRRPTARSRWTCPNRRTRSPRWRRR